MLFRSPVIQVAQPRQVVAGGSLSIKLQAVDADGDKPVFHATALPDGAKLTAAGVFTWPNASPIGIYTISVLASDQDVASDPLNLTVEILSSRQTSPNGTKGGGGAMDLEWLIALFGLFCVSRYQYA